MKQTDKYGILKTTTELLDRHMSLTEADQTAKGVKLEDTLGKIYKTAESALLAYIEEVVMQIKTIEELTKCFADSCYSLGALGMRQDLMRKKLVGIEKSGAEAFTEAIDRDMKESDSYNNLRWCSDFSELELDNLSPQSLSNQAFGYSFDYADTVNKKALAFVCLLHYMKVNEINLDLEMLNLNLQYNSCLTQISNKGWKNRSLVGYFDMDGFYQPEANTEFLKIFGKALNGILEKSKDYFETMQIKQSLQSLVVRAFAESGGVKPLEVYSEIEKLIVADKSFAGLQYEDYEKIVYAKFAVNKIYGNQGISYELNVSGLQSLVDMLESLGLSGLQEVNVLMGKVKALEI